MEKFKEFISFENFITPKIIKFVLLFTVICTGAGLLFSIFEGIEIFFAMLLVSPIIIFLTKVYLEVFMIVFKIREDVVKSKKANEETNELLRELIRLQKNESAVSLEEPVKVQSND